MIWITVLAFPLRSMTFSAYGGVTSYGKSGTYKDDLIKSQEAVQKSFYGLNALMIENTQNSQRFTS